MALPLHSDTATLLQAAAALALSLDLDDALESILACLQGAVPFDRACILLLAGDRLQRLTEKGGAASESFREWEASVAGPLFDEIRQARRPVIVPDASADPRLNRDPIPDSVRAWIGVPLVARGQLVGYLTLASREPSAYDERAAALVQAVGHQAAAAIAGAQLLDEVRVSRERLHNLSRRLVDVQEAERRHIARELHDEIGQSLTAVKISLQTLQRRLSGLPASASQLDESIGIVERSLQQVRTLSLDLRPSLLDDLGLVDTLRWYVDRQAQWGGFDAQFQADPSAMNLPPELETTCFRIVQEALTNVMRHAQACHVTVTVRQISSPDADPGSYAEIELAVSDDGVGFDVHTALKSGKSSGLLGMQERALLLCGEIDIQSAPGRGTRIQARFPLGSSDVPGPCPPESFDDPSSSITGAQSAPRSSP